MRFSKFTNSNFVLSSRYDISFNITREVEGKYNSSLFTIVTSVSIRFFLWQDKILANDRRRYLC